MTCTTWPAPTTPPVGNCSLQTGCPYSVSTGLACLRILLSCLWSKVRDAALQVRSWGALDALTEDQEVDYQRHTHKPSTLGRYLHDPPSDTLE